MFSLSRLNTAEVTFENSYVSNSAGLHKYVDPKDNQTYIYSHLEPFNCHRWFPCFDQPSVRAPLTITLAVPSKDWTVVSNANAERVVNLLDAKAEPFRSTFEIPIQGLPEEEDCRIHFFKPTPPISTYIYGLFAGPFYTYLNDNGPVPMRILAS
jgi:aminopeptidase N